MGIQEQIMPEESKELASFYVKNPELAEQIATAYMDYGWTAAQCEEFYKVSNIVIRGCVAFAYGLRYGRTDPTIDPSTLSATAQEKLDRAIKQQARTLKSEFEYRVQQEAQKRLKEVMFPAYQKRLDDANRVLKGRKGVMTKKEYDQIRSCLHPDSNMSAEKRASAFATFNAAEINLLDNKEDQRRDGLPDSLEELLARRFRQ